MDKNSKRELKGYDYAISFDALYEGLRKSCLGVKWKTSVTKYWMNGLVNTYKLQQSLLDGTYKIGEYQRFMIYEPKVREIVATRIKDRQFQRSLCDNVLYPALTKSFIRDNCACQYGKGVNDALDRMDAHLHKYYRKHGADGWALKCDIHHFFAETRHDVIMAAVEKRIKDERVIEHVRKIVDSYGGDRGIGLGSQVSQLVELTVLDDFDHWVKEVLQVKYYIRYMDDFILIGDDKAQMRHFLELIREKLNAIGLELNSKTQIYPLRQGVKFLQWRFVLTPTGKVVRKMSHQSMRHERQKLKKLSKFASREILEQSFQSWRAHAEHGNTYKVVENMKEYMKGVLKNVNSEKHCETNSRAGSSGEAKCYAE